jgi:hypothetical protein
MPLKPEALRFSVFITPFPLMPLSKRRQDDRASVQIIVERKSFLILLFLKCKDALFPEIVQTLTVHIILWLHPKQPFFIFAAR